MSTNILYTNLSNSAVTVEQLSLLDSHLKHIFEDDELKVSEYWSFSNVENKIVQMGGFYYLSANENLNEVINDTVDKGKNWTFYYNKVENTQGDTLWDYQAIYNEVLESQGKTTFDSSKREIANTVLSQEQNKYVVKSKMFYGDPLIFPRPYETAATFTFYYNEDTNIPYQVVCEYGVEIENDYSIDEFLDRESIMSIFPWAQHSYYHNFEPMLP